MFETYCKTMNSICRIIFAAPTMLAFYLIMVVSFPFMAYIVMLSADDHKTTILDELHYLYVLAPLKYAKWIFTGEDGQH